MFSRKKLNTYGVESPCECLPRVGSFLAYPGLSKEQLVPSCVVRTFVIVDIFIEILAQNLRRCVVATFRNYGFIHGNAGIISTTLRINDKSIRLR